MASPGNPSYVRSLCKARHASGEVYLTVPLPAAFVVSRGIRAGDTFAVYCTVDGFSPVLRYEPSASGGHRVSSVYRIKIPKSAQRYFLHENNKAGLYTYGPESSAFDVRPVAPHVEGSDPDKRTLRKRDLGYTLAVKKAKSFAVDYAKKRGIDTASASTMLAGMAREGYVGLEGCLKFVREAFDDETIDDDTEGGILNFATTLAHVVDNGELGRLKPTTAIEKAQKIAASSGDGLPCVGLLCSGEDAIYGDEPCPLHFGDGCMANDGVLPIKSPLVNDRIRQLARDFLATKGEV